MELKNFLIVVEDIEKSKKFYEDLFGLKLIANNDGNMVLPKNLHCSKNRIGKNF